MREHVAAFRFFLDQHPRGEGTRLLEGGQPDVAVAFVQEVANRQARARGFLHVVPERSHARHDLVAAERLRDARGHLGPQRCVGAIPLRFGHHRRRRVERAQFVADENEKRYRARGAHAALRDESRREAGADRLDRHQRHHVADAERVAFEKRGPRNGGHAEQGEHGERVGTLAADETDRDTERDAGAADPCQQRAAEHPRAPADLSRGHHRIAERLVLRHEEVVADEPFADDDAAEDREGGDGDGGVDGHRADVAQRGLQRLAAAPARPGGRDERAHGHRPGFVAREAGECEGPADVLRLKAAVRITAGLKACTTTVIRGRRGAFVSSAGL